MEKVKCPYCGALTDTPVCQRCRAEIPAEKSVKEEPAKKPRKSNKEVNDHG